MASGIRRPSAGNQVKTEAVLESPIPIELYSIKQVKEANNYPFSKEKHKIKKISRVRS
jgi:hypothetical protein